MSTTPYIKDFRKDPRAVCPICLTRYTGAVELGCYKCKSKFAKVREAQYKKDNVKAVGRPKKNA